MQNVVKSGSLFGDSIFSPGDRFRGYVVERLIGKGGLGAVYLIRHGMLDTFFALKVLDPVMAEKNPEFVKRFVREAKIASKIKHPNLVAVHDAGYDPERRIYYIVMDYIEGSTLRSTISLGGAMSDREALRIVSHVASALDAAQRFGVVHRDIKPENIMITADGTVKLIDLGVAKVATGVDTLKTMENTVFGTPSYISPEQATDASAVDARADIYSLGVVLFEMLCARRPYDATTPELVAKELLGPKPIPDVREFNPKVSPKISALLSLMCAKRPADRLDSPRALLETIARLGYSTPSVVAEYAGVTPARPIIPDVSAGANDTLSFDTKDEEIKEFVTGLKRRRRLRRILALTVVVIVVAVAGCALYLAFS